MPTLSYCDVWDSFDREGTKLINGLHVFAACLVGTAFLLRQLKKRNKLSVSPALIFILFALVFIPYSFVFINMLLWSVMSGFRLIPLSYYIPVVLILAAAFRGFILQVREKPGKAGTSK